MQIYIVMKITDVCLSMLQKGKNYFGAITQQTVRQRRCRTPANKIPHACSVYVRNGIATVAFLCNWTLTEWLVCIKGLRPRWLCPMTDTPVLADMPLIKACCPSIGFPPRACELAQLIPKRICQSPVTDSSLPDKATSIVHRDWCQ